MVSHSLVVINGGSVDVLDRTEVISISITCNFSTPSSTCSSCTVNRSGTAAAWLSVFCTCPATADG